MFTSIISGLALAGVSCVTFVAYNHPKGYARIYWFLMPLSTVVFGSLVAHNIGFYEAKGALVPVFQQPIDWQRVNGALEGKTLPIDWLIVSQVAVWVYLTVLFYLPQILSTKSAKTKIR